MNELKQEHHRFKNPDTTELHPSRGPYWKRAHRDGRIWFFVILMLAAMVIYLMTGDLSWRPNGSPQPPVPAVTGN